MVEKQKRTGDVRFKLTGTIVVVRSDEVVISGWRSLGEANGWLDEWINDPANGRSRFGYITLLREVPEVGT